MGMRARAVARRDDDGARAHACDDVASTDGETIGFAEDAHVVARA
jgi:hypothetical protein